ncbi:helix-turn-helix domain-containing protein [Rhodanobacter terrae]|uniref:Helix-turn-helix domain-containing protein n=1 Tax=Rhodanobacter terrae TaxID=418647 RepID=A0ABW0SYD9_9GAMM
MLQDTPHRPTDAILGDLGDRIRDQRIRLGRSQAELASMANVAVRALQSLEAGKNTTTHTLVRVLRALGIEGGVQSIAPLPSVSPMAALRRSKKPRRARATRVKKTDL